MLLLSIFCGLPGIPWPFTVHNLLYYIDHVLPPVYGKGLFIDLLHFNYVVIGLVVGMVIRNVIGVPRSWEMGISYTPVMMNTGIVLIGTQYMLRDLVKLGTQSITLMCIFVFGSAFIVIVLCRMLKIGDRLTGLLAAGFSMCGVSACVAIAPMVKARTDQVAYAIASLITFGIACLFILPWIGRLVGISEYAFGIWSATGVPNSAQVIATGFNYGFDAGKVAGFANIGRIVLIPAGVLFIYFLTFTAEFKKEQISYWQVIKDKFPIFVFGFVAVWLMNCFHLFPLPARHAMETVMIWFFTLCFVGIGLQTKFADVKSAGLKGLSIAWVAGIIKVVLCLGAIMLGLKLGYFQG
jgi:uncharacterized integral membrane protein (TIGR00698 family)